MQLFAQKTITGTVTSADDGTTLPGVSVLVKGTTIATVTGLDGKFILKNVPDDASTIVFDLMGMMKQEVAISGDIVDCALEKEDVTLDEVVVTALGITREKKAIDYAAQELSGDDLSKVKTTNLVSGLSGKVAGVQITQASGAVGSSANIVIRGNSSLISNQPLFVVDGTPISNGSTSVSQWGDTDFGNAAMDIDPSNIESMTVLKGTSATALYGSRGANGVVLITTKKGKAQKGVGVTISSGVTVDQVYILPNFQNKYGQGYNGSEYYFNKYGETYGYNTYQDWSENMAFSYVDGNGDGVHDGMDESWGPKLDAGLKLPQFNSPYTVDPVSGDVTYDATPWVSNPDNVKNFFDTGLTLDNNVQIVGGNDKANSRLSVSNMNVKGAIPNTDLKKNTVSFNGNLNLSDRLTASASVSYVNNRSDNLPQGGYSPNNVMQSIGGWFGRQVDMNSLRENWETLDPYGNHYNWNQNYHNNPYMTSYKNTTSRQRDRVYGNTTLSYKLTDWLDIVGRLGNDFYTEQRKSVMVDGLQESGPGGNFWQSSRKNNELNADLFLNFDKSFTDDIRLNGMIGGNYRSENYSSMYLEAAGLTVPNFFTIGNASGNPSTAMYDKKLESNSVFTNANFSFKNYLFLNGSFRNDWSSTLPSEEWSYAYYSGGMSFIFSDAFGLKSDLFSFGKLRASYGVVGNDTDPYRLDPVYASSSDLYNGITQYYVSRELPPVLLKPERSYSMEGGIELRFLNDRFGIDFTAYNTRNTNQILGVDITPSSGYESMLINAGEIQTQGIEIISNLGFVDTKNFKWNMTINWSTYQNVVNKLYGDLESYQFSTSWASVSVEARPEETFGVIRGKGFQRDDQGRILIDPTSGLPQATADPINLGNITPDWIGGVRNTFTFFNSLSLSVLVDGSKGGDIFSVSDWFGGYAGILSYTAEGDIRENGLTVGEDVMTEQDAVYGELVEDVDDEGVGLGTYSPVYYDGDGLEVTTPVVNTDTVSAQNFFEGYYGYGAEQSIIDASYIKLREASITYSLPKSVVDNISFIQGVSLSFVGHNLALLYTDKSNRAHIDPETGFGAGLDGRGLEQYQIPSTRSLGFKVQVKF